VLIEASNSQWGSLQVKSIDSAYSVTRNSCCMKNVTITVDDDVLRWARVWAARHDTSVSRMLGEELRRKMLSEKQYERAKRHFQARAPKALKPAGASYPARESLYER
jgi:plasmid stability protein